MENESMGKRVNIGSKTFNAVDLITVIVFAALVRVLWVVFKTAGVIFPFNHSFMHFFSAFCLVACISVVQKRWTAFYYTVGWCAINFFLQGEHWAYWALIVLAPIIPELYLKARSKNFKNPDDVYQSLKDLTVSALVYTIVYFSFAWWSIIYIYYIPVNWGLSALAFAGALILTVVGSWLGHKVGIRLSTLIG